MIYIVHLPDSTSSAYFTGQSFILPPPMLCLHLTFIQYLFLLSERLYCNADGANCQSANFKD
jgi:hypothetical protein